MVKFSGLWDRMFQQVEKRQVPLSSFFPTRACICERSECLGQGRGTLETISSQRFQIQSVYSSTALLHMDVSQLNLLSLTDALSFVAYFHGSALSWEGGGLRLALAVDSYIYLANIRPEYKWVFFGSSTCMYSFKKRDHLDHSVMFWDIGTGER